MNYLVVMKADHYFHRLTKMSESAVIVVCALVAITALGNSANLTNRSVERNSFETFSSDGQFIIGKNR